MRKNRKDARWTEEVYAVRAGTAMPRNTKREKESGMSRWCFWPIVAVLLIAIAFGGSTKEKPPAADRLQTGQEQISSAEVKGSASAEEQASSAITAEAFREKLKEYTYVGSSESDRYHIPTCYHTEKIHEGNFVHFDSKEEAVSANYKPCGTCKPN